MNLSPAPGPIYWNVGDHLEVAGEADPNGEFKHSFSLAFVRAKHPDGSMLLEYIEFLTETGEKLTEVHPANSPHLRPPVPRQKYLEQLSLYKAGDTVEVYEEDIWWQGVVTRVSLSAVNVCRAELDGVVLVASNPAFIRLGYAWDHGMGVWRRYIPPRQIISRLRVLRKEQLDAKLQVMQSEPPLMRDGSVAHALATLEHAQRVEQARRAEQEMQERLRREAEATRLAVGDDDDEEVLAGDDSNDEDYDVSEDEEEIKIQRKKEKKMAQKAATRERNARNRGRGGSESDGGPQRPSGHPDSAAARQAQMQAQMQAQQAAAQRQQQAQMQAQMQAKQQQQMQSATQLQAQQAMLPQLQAQQAKTVQCINMLKQQQQMQMQAAQNQLQPQLAKFAGTPQAPQMQQLMLQQLQQLQQTHIQQLQPYQAQLQHIQQNIQHITQNIAMLQRSGGQDNRIRADIGRGGGIGGRSGGRGGSAARGRGRGRGKGGRRGSDDDEFESEASTEASEEEEEEEEEEEDSDSEEEGSEEEEEGKGLAAERSRRERKSRVAIVGGMPVLKSNADELVALPGALGARLDAGMHGPPQHHAAGQGNMPSNAGAGADGRQGPGGQQQQQPVSDKGGVPKEEEEGGGAEAGKPGKGRKRKAGSEEEGDEEEEEEGSGDENEEDGEEGASEARRAWDPSHAARMAHNKAMRNEAHERDAIRALFLKTHLDKLKMFVTEEVVETIEKESAAAPTDYAIPEPVQEQPSSIRGEMREYQVAGLQWLVRQYDHGINAILADEMGLGKTLQTIAFLAYLTFDRHVTGPHLVVVPLSVLPNWMAEFKRFAPDLRVVRIHVNDEGERQRLRREVLSDPSSFDVAVTTYDMVNSVHFGETLKHAIVWRYVVLDEGHRVKNEDALISQGMRQVQKQHVLMLTGTPVQNNLHELFALLNFMFPDVFTSSEAFDKAFNLTQNVVDTGTLEAAHYLLRPFMLRRVKDEVECKLPPKVETRINCPLSEFQTFWYRRLLLRDCEMLKQVESEAAARGMPGANPGAGGSNGGAAQGDEDTAPVQKKGRWANKQNEDGVPFTSAGPGSVSHWNKMMNLLMQLRKVCNHPYLFNIDAEPNFDGVTTGEDIVEASGKMQVLDRMLQKLKQKGHRVVLFSQFSRMLDILEDYIHLRGWKYKRLDGSTNRIQRMIDIQQFNKPNSDVFMYILCTRAGGLGVNLQTADTCILFDSDWNPQQDLQAMARVHRIGQTKPVHVYRLVSEGTVEERIQRRAEGKLYLDQMVNRGSTQGAEEMEKMNKHEVLSMLKYGADRIFKNDAGRSPTDSELDSIIDRSNMMATTATGDVKLEDPVAQAAAAAAVKPDPTSQDAAAGAVKSEADMFTTGKHSANDFNVDAPTISTFEFAGIDYKEIKMQAQNSSLKDLARMFWEERKDRLLKVEGDTDKQQQQHQGSSRPALPPPKEGYGRRRRQTAGEDYLHCDFCQRCWDGGNLLCCDFCPVAVHPHCLGLAEDEVKAIRKWGCPHHSCATCGRNTAASGGLLFRCEVCDNAFCEDHVPEGYEIMGECEHMQALGQIHPKQACFILCSANCQKLKADLKPRLEDMMQRHIARRQAEAAKEAEEEAAREAEAAAMAPPMQQAEEGGSGLPGKRVRPPPMSQRAREAQEAHAALKAAARPKASKKSQSGNGRQRRSRGYADDDSDDDEVPEPRPRRAPRNAQTAATPPHPSQGGPSIAQQQAQAHAQAQAQHQAQMMAAQQQQQHHHQQQQHQQQQQRLSQGGQGQAQGLGQQAAPATAGTAPGADLAMYRQLAMLLMQMAQAQQQAGHQQQAQTLHSIAVSLSQGQLPPGISLQQLQQLVVTHQQRTMALAQQQQQQQQQAQPS